MASAERVTFPVPLNRLPGASITPRLTTAPTASDGRLFVTTDYDIVTAFDLRTRQRLWRYEPKIGVAKPCCGPVNRGVAQRSHALALQEFEVS